MKHLDKESPQQPITADKREIKDSPKSPSATSFIRKMLGEMLDEVGK